MKTYLVINIGKPISKHKKKLIRARSEEEAARKSGFDQMEVHHIFDNAFSYKRGTELLT